MKKYLRIVLEVLLVLLLAGASTLAYMNFSGKKHLTTDMEEVSAELDETKDTLDKTKEQLDDAQTRLRSSNKPSPMVWCSKTWKRFTKLKKP